MSASPVSLSSLHRWARTDGGLALTSPQGLIGFGVVQVVRVVAVFGL